MVLSVLFLFTPSYLIFQQGVFYIDFHCVLSFQISNIMLHNVYILKCIIIPWNDQTNP